MTTCYLRMGDEPIEDAIGMQPALDDYSTFGIPEEMQ